MSLLRIAWRSITQRGLASLLTALSMALGVLLVVAVLLIMGIVSESFRSNTSLGYNMIVGAKGGDLQLVLNTVYHLSKPVENISYSFYQEFLPANHRADGRDGEHNLLTKFAIPLCLGDYYEGFRVVGTTPEMFDDFVFDYDRNRKYEFSEGRNFKIHSAKYGFFEALLGANVARETGLSVGDEFSPTHGVDGDAHNTFFVVGVLDTSGTPNDRAVFVNMEGFFLLKGHAKPVKDEDGEEVEPATLAAPDCSMATIADDSPLDEARRQIKPLPYEQREVTAIQLRTVSGLVARGLQNTINEGSRGRAVMPIDEIYKLFSTIVGPIQAILLLITLMVCVVSGVSILVSIYNSMSDRRHEIAVMRALGAGRKTVLLVVLLESIMLALGGGFLGWAGGHLLIGWLASPTIEARTGVQIGILDFAPEFSLEKVAQWLPESSFIEPWMDRSIMTWGISSEFLLIPGLILLAIVVGFLPALAAYRTDVAKALSSSP